MKRTVSVEIKNQVAIVSIDREEKLNPLSSQVFHDLESIFNELEKSSIIGAILTGQGERSFIAGADISEMKKMTSEEGKAFSAKAQALTQKIENFYYPVIACVNGFALGGGLEFALCCDFIYATENAKFGQPEVKLGLIPGFGGCVRLTRIVGPQMSKEIIYSGELLSSDQALALKIANKVFPTKSEMVTAAISKLELIGKNSLSAVRYSKGAINDSFGKSTTLALSIENEYFFKTFVSDDKEIGTTAFLEKRSPTFSHQVGLRELH